MQLAAHLREEYPAGVYVEAFENHRGAQALRKIRQLLDADHDGSLSTAEKQQARIILYGLSLIHIYGQFLRRHGLPDELVYACFLRAEGLMVGSSGNDVETVKSIRRQVESQLGRKAAAVKTLSLIHISDTAWATRRSP